MGRDCLKVLKSINLSSTENEDSKAGLKGLDNYCKPAKNEVLKDLYVFYTCNQGRMS